MLTGIVTGCRALYEKTSFLAKANAPLILRIGHLTLGAATVILACYATSKLPEIADEKDQMEENLKECIRKAERGEMTFTKEQEKKERMAIKAHVAKRIAKTYAWAVGTAIGSCACYYGEVKIASETIAGLSAAYTAAVTRAEKSENELRMLKGEIEELAKEPETEEEAVEQREKAKKLAADIIPVGSFAFMFDESNPNFSKVHQMNRYWLTGVLNQLQRRLEERTTKTTPGVVSMNEALRLLEMPERKTGEILQLDAGQVVGWTNYYDPADNEKYGAAGHISFGNLDDYDDDGGLLLVFNVDKTPLVGRNVYHNEKINNWVSYNDGRGGIECLA